MTQPTKQGNRQANRHLRQILTQAEAHSERGDSFLAVFDLDSTLFDVGPRLQQIFLDFAESAVFQKRFPEATQILKTLQTHRKDWGFQDALVRAGLDGKHPEFEHALKDFWQQRFFSNQYLHFDKPYPGARQFVESLWNLGAQIAYLTGRDHQRMGPGTVEVLEKWAFPMDSKRSKLVLKPDRELDDAQFKSDWFIQAKAMNHQKIWFFENEPKNIHLVQKEHPEVEVIFFDSTHSRHSDPPDGIPSIIDFLLDDQKDNN